MKVYEAIADALAQECGGAMFGLMGDANMFAWMTMHKDPRVRIYAARHEAAAVLMAEGFARARRCVGVVTVTCGPGVSHTATSLLAAARGRVPLVLMTGEATPYGRLQTQSLNHRRFADACEAHFQPVHRIDSLADDIREAFHAAATLQRPVLLNVPLELMEQDLPWEWEYLPSRLVLPRPAVQPADTAIEELADLLAGAERPIIIAGRGAIWSGACDAIRALADRAGALLATSLFAKGFFAGDPYDLGIAGSFASGPGEKLFADADVVLGIGASLNYYTTEGGFLFPDASVARIDTRPAPVSLGALPGLYVQGDAKTASEALLAALERRQTRNAGYRTPETLAVIAEPTEVHEPATDGIDPRRIMRDLSGMLPDDVQIVCGVGHFWGFPVLYLSLPSGASIHFTSAFGAIGQAVPLGLGVKAANPERPTLVIEGDGSLLQNLQELQTAADSGLPLTVLVLNDAGYGAEVHKLRKYGFEPGPSVWKSPDFVAIARAFGGDGVVLDDAGGLAAAIEAGLASSGLFLIDAHISKTTLSDIFLKLQYGRSNLAPRLLPAAG